MSKIELTATYSGDRFRWDNGNEPDTVIADAFTEVEDKNLFGDNQIVIKGRADRDELVAHQTYRFVGRWKKYENRRSGAIENQFHFDSFIHVQPHTRAGIVTYIAKAGAGNNIGHSRAGKLYDKFGSDAVRTLREDPELAASVLNGVTVQQAEAASLWLQDHFALENVTIEVTDLLTGRGFPKTTIKKAIREWGATAAEVIKRDPYQLMNFRGCGFKLCDVMYLQLGHDPTRLRRQAYCVWYALASNSDGHTWYPLQFAVQYLNSHIGPGSRPAAAIKMAKRLGKLDRNMNGAISIARQSNGALVENGGKVFVAEGRKAWSEQVLSKLITRHIDAQEAMDSHPFAKTMGGVQRFWPETSEIENITDHQAEVINQALSGPVCTLGGSPGTGKTYSLAQIVKALINRGIGLDNILIGAPTGKAAVRITEALQEYNIPIIARTWHSHLGVGERDERTGDWSFTFKESNPWRVKLIIGDETSMKDVPLMNSVFRAVPVGAHVLFVGDTNQLPPVGHGAPLRDMIAAGLPYGELTKTMRFSGGIVEACAAIRDNQKWVHKLDSGEWENLILEECFQPEAQIESMLAIIDRQGRQGLDRVWDCQVVVAVNDKSPLARRKLNKILQGHLNPNPPIDKCLFRKNDKVVNLKNGYFQTIRNVEYTEPGEEDVQRNDRDEVYVANGEIGRVKSVEKGFMVVSLSSPRRLIKVLLGKQKESKEGDEEKSKTGCSFDLAYALSVHKSQGSEWPVIITMLDKYPGAKGICDRSWLYTAISRAKQVCYMVGDRRTASSMCLRNKIDKRVTFLRQRIHLNRAMLQIAGL